MRAREFLQQVRDTVDRLRPTSAGLLRMRHGEGLRLREIGARLGVSTGNACVLVAKAEKEARDHLQSLVR